MSIPCTIFTTEKELSAITGLNHEQLWENGFNLDDWDIGFCCQRPLNPKTKEKWLIMQMENYCVGYEMVKFKNLYFYMVYHS